MAGVPMTGAVDTGTDLTIMGGDMFKQVAAVARLRKKVFQPADRTTRRHSRIMVGLILT